MYIDTLSVVDELDNEQAGKLLKAIKAYQCGEEIELDFTTKIAFNQFKCQFARDEEKYKKTCEARAAAGSKGGKQKAANASKSYQKLAKASKSKQDLANVADNDSDNESDSDSDSENKKKKTSSHSLDFSSWPAKPNDELLEEWIAYRKKKKLAITQRAINSTGKALNELSSYGFTVDHCLETMIDRGWQSIEARFFVNTNQRQQPQPQSVNQAFRGLGWK